MIAAEQARTFLTMMFCGAVCAAMHDAATEICTLLHGGRAAQGGIDLSLGPVLAAAVTAAGLYLEVEIERLYVFIGAGAGIAAWHVTLGFALRKIKQAVHRRNAKKKDRK